jgi:endonuclease YncB( thermonuclease family)
MAYLPPTVEIAPRLHEGGGGRAPNPSEQPQQQAGEYALAEQQAREAGLGLWREPNPIPPWDSRKGVR